jgi:vacuolar protein-sorting-associated protein 4
VANLYLPDEKNDKLRVLIRKKVDEYLDRAEKLKAHIAKAETKKPGIIGSNGKVSSSGGKYVSLAGETCSLRS